MNEKASETTEVTTLTGVYSAQAIAWAEKECGPVLAIVRKAYRPSDAVEGIVIAAFLHGAACAFNIDAELGDVASLKGIANG